MSFFCNQENEFKDFVKDIDISLYDSQSTISSKQPSNNYFDIQ